MEKTFEIIFTETASETYNSIFDQINVKWGKAVAAKFESKILRTLEIISKNPFIFKAVDAGKPNLRKGLINRNCFFLFGFYITYTNFVFLG